MEKLTDNEIQDILDRDVPGMRLVESPPQSVDGEPPDADTPDLDTLLDRQADTVEDAERHEAVPNDKKAVSRETARIVTAASEPPDHWGRGPGPKSVVLSDGRVVGYQG